MQGFLDEWISRRPTAASSCARLLTIVRVSRGRCARSRPLAAVAFAAVVLAGCDRGDEDQAASPRSDPRARASIDRQLITAAGKGRPATVRSLLRRGADVRARDATGRTALIAAAFGNHLAAARALISAGADVNAQDDTSQSAYLIATSEVGDDPRLLELTLRGGAFVNAKDSYNGTGLIRAGERAHARIVDRLLDTPIDRDHVNRLGWTALLEAIVLGEGGRRHTETVRALVRGGVDVDVADSDGVSPLQHAERRGYDAIAAILRAAGAHRRAP